MTNKKEYAIIVSTVTRNPIRYRDYGPLNALNATRDFGSAVDVIKSAYGMELKVLYR